MLKAVEASRCYFYKKWFIKHKWATLVTMQPEIYHQNSQSLYPSEPFKEIHITMRHPVACNHKSVISLYVSWSVQLYIFETNIKFCTQLNNFCWDWLFSTNFFYQMYFLSIRDKNWVMVRVGAFKNPKWKVCKSINRWWCTT